MGFDPCSADPASCKKRYRRTLQLKMSQLYQNTTGKSRKTVHICIPSCRQLLFII